MFNRDKMSIMITSDNIAAADMVVTDTATSAADNLANVMLDPELVEDICQSAANAAAESVAKPVAKENVPDEKGVVFPTFKNGARAWAATAEATIEYLFNEGVTSAAADPSLLPKLFSAKLVRRKAYTVAGRPRKRGEYKCGRCGFLPKVAKHSCVEELAKLVKKLQNQDCEEEAEEEKVEEEEGREFEKMMTLAPPLPAKGATQPPQRPPRLDKSSTANRSQSRKLPQIVPVAADINMAMVATAAAEIDNGVSQSTMAVGSWVRVLWRGTKYPAVVNAVYSVDSTVDHVEPDHYDVTYEDGSLGENLTVEAHLLELIEGKTAGNALKRKARLTKPNVGELQQELKKTKLSLKQTGKRAAAALLASEAKAAEDFKFLLEENAKVVAVLRKNHAKEVVQLKNEAKYHEEETATMQIFSSKQTDAIDRLKALSLHAGLDVALITKAAKVI